MTAIADKIRALLGITGAMGLDAMAANLTTAQSEVTAQNDLIAQIATALEGKTAAAPASPQVLTTTPSSNSRSISFTGLTHQPTMFAVMPSANTSLSSSTRYAICVLYDGSSTRGVYSNNSTATHTTNGFTFTYSNGTLTIDTASTSNGGYFRSGVTYQLVYM